MMILQFKNLVIKKIKIVFEFFLVGIIVLCVLNPIFINIYLHTPLIYNYIYDICTQCTIKTIGFCHFYLCYLDL